MIKLLPAISICLIIIACSRSEDQPVYDTAKNPDNFPNLAIALLDSIEIDSLTTFEEISDRFGQLYTDHPGLLGDERWPLLVSRLGLRFQRKGEQFLEKGLTGYSAAADYFALAALARPTDSAVQARYDLFSCWREAAANPAVAVLLDSVGPSGTIEARLRLIRRFILSDSLSSRFAEKFLISELLALTDLPLTALDTEGLTEREIAMASYLELIEYDPSRKFIAFSDPEIDLAYVGISPQADSSFLAEFYFYPRESIDLDLTIALRLFTTDREISPFAESLRYVPFDFQPVVPTSQWKAGKLALAYRSFRFAGELTGGAVGLADRSVTPPHYLKHSDSNEQFFQISFQD